MKGKSLIAAAALLLFPLAPAMAQDTLQQEATQLVKQTPHKNFFSLSIENDSLGSGSDRNYTSGVRASYFNINAKIPSFIATIVKAVPTFDINDTTSISWSLGQNLYTPRDITVRTQDPNDRPWAAWLYGSAGLTTLTGNHIDELELTLGMVGPAAQGEATQKFVHRLLGARTPRGWDNQLHDEPGLIVSWNRRWPEAAKFETMGLYGTVEPNLNISLGNIYTYAGSGVTLKLSPSSNRWQDTPPRVRPAIPGSGFFAIPQDDWSWYVFAGLDERAVARNIFLDGNTFRDSHSVDKNTFVTDVSGGLALTYQRVRLSYSLVYRSDEFEQQHGSSLFGSVSLSYRY